MRLKQLKASALDLPYHDQLVRLKRLKIFQPKGAVVSGFFNRSATAIVFERINRTSIEPGIV